MAGLRTKLSRVGTQVAAEHVALADEYGRYSGQPLHMLAAELMRKPIWHFWWD